MRPCTTSVWLAHDETDGRPYLDKDGWGIEKSLYAGVLESMSNDRTNGRLAQKSTDRSFAAQKHPTTGAARPTMLQVLCNRFASICWERKCSSLATFTLDAYLADTPVNIIKIEKGYFA